MYVILARQILAVLALAAFVTACGPPAAPEAAVPPRPVKMAEATAHAPSITYSASGRIKARQRAELSFDRGDTLSDLPVTQGQEVREGEVLARLDSRNLALTEKARAARFDEAKRQVERMQRLFDRQAIAEADLERARTTFEASEAEWLQVRKDLEGSALRAPFSGRVAATLADRYQIVQAKQPIVVVHDLSSYEVEISIPETFILQVGKTTNIAMFARFEHLPGRRFPVTVKSFATEADPQTLTYRVVFSLPAPEDTVILPGMSAAIELTVPLILGESKTACWVPDAAVFSIDGKTSEVWLVDPAAMMVHRRAVKTGSSRGGLVQVVEGVKPGDWLAVSGLHSLEEGQAIRRFESDDGN